MNVDKKDSGKKQLSLESRFYSIVGPYLVFFVVVCVFYFKERKTLTGIVIGGIFPALSFLYIYRNYMGEKGKAAVSKRKEISVMSWTLPALFVHVIITFGFCIVLTVPTAIGFKDTMFSSGYMYTKIFKSYNEKYVGTSLNNDKEMSNVIKRYSPYFREKASPSKEKSISSTHQKSVANEINKISGMIDKIPFMVALTYGFLGALIFSLGDAISRFNNVDMYPKINVFYVVRFIISASLAVTLSPFVMEELPAIMSSLMFFGIGYFPERAINYIDDKMTKYMGFKTQDYVPVPLSLIQGMTPEKALRFREIGIEDVQHLAHADIEHLEENLPYNRSMLCDWMAQSQLHLQFPNNTELLKIMEIRTILDFDKYNLEEKELLALCKKKGITKEKLDNFLYLKQVVKLPPEMRQKLSCLEEVVES